jgi:hypothetical protein
MLNHASFRKRTYPHGGTKVPSLNRIADCSADSRVRLTNPRFDSSTLEVQFQTELDITSGPGGRNLAEVPVR